MPTPSPGCSITVREAAAVTTRTAAFATTTRTAASAAAVVSAGGALTALDVTCDAPDVAHSEQIAKEIALDRPSRGRRGAARLPSSPPSRAPDLKTAVPHAHRSRQA